MTIVNAARHAVVVGVLALLNTVSIQAGVEVTLIGEWDGFGGSYADIWGDGDFAYIGHFGGSAVNIVNITDPANPVGIEYALPPPNTSSSAQDVKVGDGLLFIGLGGSGASVHIVDVRTPMSPVGLVDIDIAGLTSVHNVFYDNGWLYIVDSGTPRIGVVDLTGFDPDNPPASPITTLKWMMEGVGSSFVHDITVVGGRLYAAAWDSGLWIYDVSNVATEKPTFLGSTPGNNTHSCWPTDSGDFVVTAEERSGGGIQVYRVTAVGASVDLSLTDSFALPTNEAFSVHNPLIVGNRIYNSWYEAGLLIFDIDPVTGLLDPVATFDTAVSVWGVYPLLGPERVLLSERDLGLLVVSVGSGPVGDRDGDGMVGITVLLIPLGDWGPGDAPCPPEFPADLDDDCDVGITDFLLLLANWG